jgi:16S rRNA G966 N2-methylase RsmD
MGRKSSKSSGQENLLHDLVDAPAESHYFGEKPNPHVSSFLKAHVLERPFSLEADNYSTKAFDRAIDATKATALYNIHSYWSKKPHDAIREYIRHYTCAGDLVLDPFCGSGGTALAALLEKRSAVAIDRSPAATFITKSYCSPVNIKTLLSSYDRVLRQAKPEIDYLYETRCERCDGTARTAFTVYSQIFQCPRCLNRVALYDCEQVEGQTAQGKPKTVNICPLCAERGVQEVIRSQSEKFGFVPVSVSYECLGACRPKRQGRSHRDEDKKKREFFEKYDLAKIREIEEAPISYWYPRGYDMSSFSRFQRDALYYYGVREVSDLFTHRNLRALATLKDAIGGDPQLYFAFSAILLNSSRMYRHRSGGGGGPKGTDYMIPQIGREVPVWPPFEEKVKALAQGSQHDSCEFLVSTQSACDLGEIPYDSVDFIFTDPPYAGTIQYGELSALWEAWMGVSLDWHKDEITVNAARGRTEQDWGHMMHLAMAECFRVLKPGRWLSLCYHDTSEGTWSLIQDIMAEVGFVVDNAKSALFIDTQQKSYNQLTADKVTKRDLVINFRKPKPNEIAAGPELTGDEDAESFGEKLRILISDFLSANPGAPKDRIYDHVVSHMVRAGAMQAHNFEEFLAQVAEPVQEPVKKNLFEDKDPDLFGTHEVVRWYLKATQLDVVDAAETAKEERASDALSSFIQTKLKESPWLDGVHYSDLFEHFIYAVHEKPRRPMIEWLLDYFFKTASGTYRLPGTDEEARLKAEGRSKGTGRRIKRYLAFIEHGITIPTGEQPNDSTLADWIRHAKLSGMYAAGKMLFERGGLSLDRLDEEATVNVEEDYQVCVRMLSRQEKG